MKSIYLIFSFFIICTGIAAQSTFKRISVHPEKHYLQTADGKPFFWLGDTAWELFHRLNREEAEAYLETRRQQGFNVIQAVVLAEFDGLRKPNVYWDLPLQDFDPTQLITTPGNNPKDSVQYDYWDHVDFVIRTAAKKGLYIGLLPTWGDKLTHLWGDGPVIFNEKNARVYGKIVAERYKNDTNIIWILGGDRPAVYEGKDKKQYDDRPIWSAMAAGIQEVADNEAFITYHPSGGEYSTSQYIHEAAWLDMNAFQSGHGSRESAAWAWVERDWKKEPTKPVLDMEPCYEDHPVNPWDGKWTRQRGYFVAYDVRARIYRSIFAGACGVTYGHHFIWQFANPVNNPLINNVDTIITWRQAMLAEAAGEMQFLKKLMLSRPYFSRVSDQSLIVSKNGETYLDHIRATRDANGSYAMIYLPENKSITIDINKISGAQKTAWWFDPRTGKAIKIGNFKGVEFQSFTPPKTDKDWVLVIDDQSKKYAAPGKT